MSQTVFALPLLSGPTIKTSDQVVQRFIDWQMEQIAKTMEFREVVNKAVLYGTNIPLRAWGQE